MHLDRVLDAFAEFAPGTAVDLVSASAADRLAGVAGGGLDAAFVRGAWPPAVPPDLAAAVPAGAEGVCVVPLWADPLVAVVPGRHPLAGRAEIAVAELAGLPLRLVPRRRNPPLVDLVLNACHDAGFEPVPGPAAPGRAARSRTCWPRSAPAHRCGRSSTPRTPPPCTRPGSPSCPSAPRAWPSPPGWPYAAGTPRARWSCCSGLRTGRRSRYVIAAVAECFLVRAAGGGGLEPHRGAAGPGARTQPEHSTGRARTGPVRRA